MSGNDERTLLSDEERRLVQDALVKIINDIAKALRGEIW